MRKLNTFEKLVSCRLTTRKLNICGNSAFAIFRNWGILILTKSLINRLLMVEGSWLKAHASTIVGQGSWLMAKTKWLYGLGPGGPSASFFLAISNEP